MSPCTFCHSQYCSLALVPTTCTSSETALDFAARGNNARVFSIPGKRKENEADNVALQVVMLISYRVCCVPFSAWMVA